MDPVQREQYIQKRQFLMISLRDLIGHWDLAQEMYEITISKDVTPEFIDQLIRVLESAIAETKETVRLELLEEAHRKVMDLKREELQESRGNEGKMEDLLSQL